MSTTRTTTTRVRLAAVDDHPVVLTGVATAVGSAPDVDLVAVTTSVDALLGGSIGPFDVVLLDLRLPGDGVEADVDRLRRAGARVIVYTSEERPVPIRRAMAAGASGLVLKVDPLESVVEAVREVHAGGMACSGPVAKALLGDDDSVVQMPPRQVEILRAIADGLPYRVVARRLGITESTVREHLNRAVRAYRDRGIEPGNSHGLVTQARLDGNLDERAG